MPSVSDMRLWSRVDSLLIAGCLLLLAGCGAPPRPEAPQVVAVQGTVTYRGRPVPGAVVTFRHGSDHEKSAFAIADAQGKFSGMTNDTDGMFPGDYRVTVTKTEGTGKLPAKYATADLSPLTVTVKAGEPQQVPIDLVD